MPPWTDANPSLKAATVGAAPSHCPRPVYALCAFHGTTAESNVHYLVWRGRGGAKKKAILVCRKFIVGTYAPTHLKVAATSTAAVTVGGLAILLPSIKKTQIREESLGLHHFRQIATRITVLLSWSSLYLR